MFTVTLRKCALTVTPANAGNPVEAESRQLGPRHLVLACQWLGLGF